MEKVSTSVLPNLISPRTDSKEVLEPPPVKKEKAPKISFRQKLIQIVIPRVPQFQIPADTQHLILGIPGFLCTKAALKPGIDELNQDGIAYLDWGDAIDCGFTNGIVKHVDNYVKALTQEFGGKISVHGNSLGGFLAYFAAYSNPNDINRLILTASPHLLTLDPTTLAEHTNIAPFIGVMNNMLLARVMSRDTISVWERFRAGDLADDIQEFWKALEDIELLIFAAQEDTTVRGSKCLSEQTSEFIERLILDPEYAMSNKPENRPNVREFVVPGDHVDVFRGATDAIRFLAPRPLQCELPVEIQSALLPVESIKELERRSPRNVAWDFTRTSMPSLPSITSVDVRGAFHSTINAPASLLHRVAGKQSLALEPIALGR